MSYATETLLLVAALVSMLVLIAVVVFQPGDGRVTRLVQRRVRCPVHDRDADVTFAVEGTDGEVYRDVVECSLVAPDAPVECERVCRSTSVAPFGTAVETTKPT